MYANKEEAIVCPKGDVCLMEDFETRLVYNAAFFQS
jgi:hypothetical protein